MNKETAILHYENRIRQLSVHEVQNQHLINKAKRKLRALRSS